MTGVNTWAKELSEKLPADIFIIGDKQYKKELNIFNTIKRIGFIKNINDYNNIIISYGSHQQYLNQYTGNLIFVVHGYADVYQINKQNRKPNIVVNVSKNIADRFNYSDIVIENGINTNFFIPSEKKIEYDVFWHSRYPIPLILKESKYKIITSNNNNEKEILNFIQKSKIVIGTGRSALESMSCNKPTFIWAGGVGNEHTLKYGGFSDGWANVENFELLKNSNWNGNFKKNIIENLKFLNELPKNFKLRDKILTIEEMSNKYREVLSCK